MTVINAKDVNLGDNEAVAIKIDFDGVIISFSPKVRLKKVFTITKEGGVKITFYFKDGRRISRTIDKDHPMFSQLAGHGASQKFGDAGNKVETINDSYLAIDEMFTQVLDKEQWTSKRAPSGMKSPTMRNQALLAAIVSVRKDDGTEYTMENLLNFLASDSATDETVNYLLSTQVAQETYLRLKEEALAAKREAVAKAKSDDTKAAE